MRTKELAEWVGIASGTLRAWTIDEFRQYMSPTAQGGDGRVRNFTDTDARVIAFIVAMKEQGTPAEEIHLALQQMQQDNWSDLPPMPVAPPGVGPIPVIPREAAETAVITQRAAMMREISLLQDRVESLQTSLNADRESSLQALTIERENSARALALERENHDRAITLERDRIAQLQRELIAARTDLGLMQGRLRTLERERRSSLWWVRVLVIVVLITVIVMSLMTVIILRATI